MLNRKSLCCIAIGSTAAIVLLVSLFQGQAFSQGIQGLENRPLLKKFLEQRAKNGQSGAGTAGLGQLDGLKNASSKYDLPLAWLSENPKPLHAGDYGRKLICNGEERSYLIHVPKTYDASKATPVVLVFHGGGGNPNQQRYDSRMDEVSEKHNFIAVYPAGSGPVKDRLLTWNGSICCGYAQKKNVDDVAFVRQLLDDLSNYVNLDKKRVFATGLSNGAIMSYRLACELSDRIAAIAPVAYQVSVDTFGKLPERPVSVIHFHGVHDGHASYNGGKGAEAYIQGIDNPSVKKAIETWVKHNGCPAKPSRTEQKGNANATHYGPGKNNSEVILWVLKDGGHTWPGGRVTDAEARLKLGHINTDINASELMWNFFQHHPLK